MQDDNREGPGQGKGVTPMAGGEHPAAPVDSPEELDETGRGREAWRPGEIDLKGWSDIFRRVGGRVGRDLVPLVAAGVAFFGMLTLFPAIAALASLAGLVLDTDIVFAMLDALGGLAPAEPLALVREQAVSLAEQGSGRATITAVISFVLSFFWASRGIDNLVSGINMAHVEDETRNLVMRNAVSLLLTAALGGMLLLTVAAASAVPTLVRALGFEGPSPLIVSIGRWPLMALLSMASLGLLYRHAAARRPPRWSWVTPGAIFATALWLGGSVLFSVFVQNFGAYQPTYGAIAGVVILNLYMWLTAFVVLFGALLNAEMEHQSRRDTTRGRTRPMGQRDAEMADTLGKRG
ncbi:YihY/virulence factor BrkB family protein [Palleronia abyssalis]|uniref:Uncharacterized protein n=1 Tax=Palleronia abyssalis TaxID=1501240 RepID=A0A2R8BS28_9RHOB|nr:YihY/virulence factor BrkB family protein [Palleronia abyssalis]SPJ22960.1 hypothetical protein PAA8504_00761 [Palleronia abyssalis]